MHTTKGEVSLRVGPMARMCMAAPTRPIVTGIQRLLPVHSTPFIFSSSTTTRRLHHARQKEMSFMQLTRSRSTHFGRSKLHSLNTHQSGAGIRLAPVRGHIGLCDESLSWLQRERGLLMRQR